MTEQLRHLAHQALESALSAVEPAAAVRAHIRRDGDDVVVGDQRFAGYAQRRCWVIGAGKASAPMAAAVVEQLAGAVVGGVVVVKDDHALDVPGVMIYEAAHPVPDSRGASATRAMAALVSQAQPQDLVIACWSGGASALLSQPAAGISLDEYQATTQLLLGSGLDIHAANTIRKHLTAVTGGRLGALSEAPVLALVVSDVIGDDPAVIGSGPTSPDPTTFADAVGHCQRGQLWDRLPESVRTHLEAGLDGRISDTPSADQMTHCHNVVVASNHLALSAAAETLTRHGYQPAVHQEWLHGEAAGRAKDLLAMPEACVVVGGETTVTLGDQFGTGGRNQEFALAVAQDLNGADGIVVLSAGTDGTDGPNDAAGGLVDGGTWTRIVEAGFDPQAHLTGHDAYPVLDAAGDLLRTGPTKTNVMDIAVLLRAQ